ncbi:MAG: 2,3,4,5-tetrahydropyridine-2,6-dicarboxylate N-succinyltransferase, partial [Pseudomonadota bacterium]|nr:2,3,4,5-tetrahydropyridine-2,6-dicarboxylate N-succinyltransferase [Pseudomonadota bacterium]
MNTITETIVAAYENRASLTRSSASAELVQAIQDALKLLDNGDARVAEPTATGWVVNEWLKKAVLLSFILGENRVLESGDTKYYDKVAGKFDSYDDSRFQTGGYRVVPPAMVRHGAYLAPNVILMPSYVNIGAYVGEGTMVDTWATVGSCAQIGKNVHLSGGVGIGGVLEPLQASPTI